MTEFIVRRIIGLQHLIATLRVRARGAQEGQGLVEYALILAFVAVAIILAFQLLQPAIVDTFNRVTNGLNTSSTPIPLPTATP